MGNNYALTEEERKACRDAFKKREQRGREFERRLERLQSIGTTQLPPERMNEWARRMKEMFMHGEDGKERIANRYLTNDESWKELKRIWTIMSNALRSGQSVTEADPAGERILQSRFTADTLFEACRQASRAHTIEFVQKIQEIHYSAAANDQSTFRVMSEWVKEMQRTFVPDGVATEYLRDGEGWKEIKTMLDVMSLRIFHRMSVPERTPDGSLGILSRFTPKALLDSLESYHPLPSTDNLPPSTLLAPARSAPFVSPILNRVSHGRSEHARSTNVRIGSVRNPQAFEVGRREGPLIGTFSSRDPQVRRRLRLWTERDFTQRAERMTRGSENE